MTELEPCPFCPGEPAVVKAAIDGSEHYIVKCRNCHSTSGVMQMSEALAARAWNARYERTCRMYNDDWSNYYGDEYKHLYDCDVCGESTASLYCINAHGDTDWVRPKYCSSCGARVVER